MELCISLYFLPGFLFCKLPKLGNVPTTMNRSVSGVSTSITLRTAAVICASPPSSICITQFTVHNNTTNNIVQCRKKYLQEKCCYWFSLIMSNIGRITHG